MKNFEYLERLKQSGILKRASELPPAPREEPFPITQLFPEGSYIETPSKPVFKREKKFTVEEKIGKILIQDFFEFSKNFSQLFSVLGKNEKLKQFQLDKLIFFDVESTGLSSGAGNMVFLIGLGFFDDQHNFIIQQYFIDDFINEQGLLYLLKNIFQKKYHLISFNGKSFDFYILKNRFILSRKFDFTLNNLFHFDLLHSSRRMWKDRVEEYSLNQLEKSILGFYRTDEDIPGYLIPEYYKNYLKTHNAKILEKIFYHNLMDVKSMLGILVVQLKNIHLIQNGIFPEDVHHANMAHLIKDLDEDLYIQLLKQHYYKQASEKHKTLLQLYYYYKKQKEKIKMQEYLNELLQIDNEFHYPIYKEMSIYYERYEKNYQAAQEILHQAQNRIDQLMRLKGINFDREMDDIIKRRDRLNRKCLKK